MTDLLNIGASGLRAYAKALSTVGDNIANAQTPGYARRTVALREAPAAGDIVLSRNAIRPGGVEVAGVRRAQDIWLVDDARNASGEAERSAARLGWVEAAERALDDGPAGVGQSLTRVFISADMLAANPASSIVRAQFLQAVDDAAGAFRTTAAGLARVAEGAMQAATVATDSASTDLAALEQVNIGLRRTRAGSTNEATLLDARDRLLDRLSAALPVAASFDARGAVTVTASDTGQPLLADGQSATLSAVMLADGRIAFAANPGGALAPSSGVLAGLVQGADHIAAQRAALDNLAVQFTADLNGWHQAGSDTHGQPGQALLTGYGAINMVAAALTSDAVAAADASGPNGNALHLAGLRGAPGVESGWLDLLGQQAQQVASARVQDGAASSRRDGAFAARDAISEVDLDREAADLLRYQQAYEAAARTVQIARETMQSILNIF